MTLLQHFIRSLIDWVFRRRSPALLIMQIGLACLALAFGAGWALDVSFPFQGGHIDVGLDSAGGTPIVLVWTAATIGLGRIGAGFVWRLFATVRSNAASLGKGLSSLRLGDCAIPAVRP